MSGSDDIRPEDEAPGPVPIRDAREARDGLSIIWLIPALAVAAALFVAWQNYASRGPLIEIAFAAADGVRPGETELRYRDIPVGVVEEVLFAEGLDQVVAVVRLEQDVAGYVDAEAAFWIVRPEVTAQGVTGLDTVLSGVYIAGRWDGEQGASRTRFTGLENAPLLALGEEAVTFTLSSPFELPPEGTPILYRGVEVGQLGRAELTEDGLLTFAPAVIRAPHDRLVTSATRFWDVSGLSFSVGAQGARLDVSSLASLVTGGITFDTMASGGEPFRDGDSFRLHPDEETAREDFFLEGDGGSVDLMMIFDENLAGLQVGAAVSLGGLRLGEVSTISGIVDPDRYGDTEVRLVATIRVNPARLGLSGDNEAFLDFLEARVQGGLRGRLASGSLLTGGLKIDLVDLPEASPAALIRSADPYPELPTAPADITNVAASAQGLIARVEALPVEALLDETIGFLADARRVIGSQALQEAPDALLTTLRAVEAVATSPEITALPAQIGTVTEGLAEAATILNALLDEVEDEAVIAEVSTLIATLNSAAETLPGLADQTAAVLRMAEALPFETVLNDVAATAQEATALLQDEALQALPGDAQATVAGLRSLVEDEALTGLPAQLATATDQVTASLVAVEALLAEAEAAGIVTQASDVLAELTRATESISTQANAVLAGIEALPLAELTDDVATTVQSANDILTDADLTALPAELGATLSGVRAVTDSPDLAALPAQLSQVVGEMQVATERVNALLEEAQQAEVIAAVAGLLTSLETTAAQLPGIADQASAVLDQAEALSLDALAADASALLESVDTLLAQDSTRALPDSVNATLAELRATLSELREGGVVENANATLAAARGAAEAISEASSSLPDLADRLSQAARQAGDTLTAYDRGSEFGRELSAAIRQIESAAASIDRLARQIQRNPSSLITGR